MKKVITLLLTATLTMTALAGCSTSSNNADNTASSTSATTQETESTKTEQTQTEKALALIDTFATGDTDIAKELLAEDYIQHNLAYGTGRDALSVLSNTWLRQMKKPLLKTSGHLKTVTKYFFRLFTILQVLASR